jgi:DNA-binding transcriptional regulator YiaG
MDVKKLRESLGMTQVEFGNHLGEVLGSWAKRRGDSVCRWEKGVFPVPEWLALFEEKINETDTRK